MPTERTTENCLVLYLTVTMFIFSTTSTRTRIIPTYFLFFTNYGLHLLGTAPGLSSSSFPSHFFRVLSLICGNTTHIGFLLSGSLNLTIIFRQFQFAIEQI